MGSGRFVAPPISPVVVVVAWQETDDPERSGNGPKAADDDLPFLRAYGA